MDKHNSVSDGIKGTYHDESLSWEQRFKLVPLSTKQDFFYDIFKKKINPIVPFNGKGVLSEYMSRINLLSSRMIDDITVYDVQQDTLNQVKAILLQEGVKDDNN